MMNDNTSTPINNEGLKSIPVSEKEHPIFGNLLSFQQDALDYALQIAQTYGPIVRTDMAHLTFYYVTHPDFIRHILQKNNRNYVREARFLKIMKTWVKVNLFVSDGDVWLRQRRIMQPAFHRRKVNQFATMIVKETEDLLAEWAKMPANQAIDIQATMMNLSFQIIGQAMFSINMTQDGKALRDALDFVADHVMHRNLYPFSTPLFVPTKSNRTFKEALHLISDKIQTIIDQRHQEDSGEYDLLDMLLAARDEEDGSRLSDEQLIREMQGIFFAGHETTAQTLAWTWHALSEHPEVEAKLQAELDSVLQGRPPTVEDLPKLKYNLQVIQESMRFYPAIWGFSRQAVADDNVEGYLLPKDSKIVINIYGLHRHPDYWENPHQFDPEHFNPERVAKRDKFAFLPFGGGPRQCIGAPLAMLEAQLILATIAQTYRLRPVAYQAVVPDPKFTLKIKNGLLMLPEKRY